MSSRPPTLVVIGASAGGIEALRPIIAGLPADFPAAVFVVVHLGAHKSHLPWLLSQIGSLPVVHPLEGDEVRGGMIFVAPPDHHMIVRNGKIRLTKGPRENWARPAIDPLFRSAAESCGASVVGVILSGGLNDGSAGLYQIKESGGVTIVQDPADAINPSMPRSALTNVAIDHCLPAAEIATVLVDLVATMAAADTGAAHPAIVARQEEVMTAYTSDLPGLRRRAASSATRQADAVPLPYRACLHGGNHAGGAVPGDGTIARRGHAVAAGTGRTLPAHGAENGP